jgi:hypothetical protein
MIDWDDTEVSNDYYVWLCELVGVDQITKSYWKLARVLFRKAFYWTVPNDDNRAFEAKNLREKFCEELDIEFVYDQFPEDVSMFELIIGLAYRCEYIMSGQDDNMPMSDWFWKMVSNVDLTELDDDKFEEDDEDKVLEILDKIVKRSYKRNGGGGLFPLKHSKTDQRKIELWYQMSEYLVENYYSEDEVM